VVHGLMTPVTKKQWQRSERVMSQGQVSGNQLQDGSLLIPNIGNVTIAKTFLLWFTLREKFKNYVKFILQKYTTFENNFRSILWSSFSCYWVRGKYLLLPVHICSYASIKSGPFILDSFYSQVRSILHLPLPPHVTF
jgi:hypothetical protein